MKKAIVFDLGNVLVSFQPKDMLDSITQDETIKSDLHSFYFGSLWNAYDLGKYSKEEMIQLGIETYPLYQKEIETLMNTWVKYLQPIESSLKFVSQLKQEGYDIYILSNLPKQAFDYLSSLDEMKEVMKKGIYSYQHHLNKPDLRIYQRLLNTYAIESNQTIFVDDKKENVEAAIQLGFQAIHCMDVNQLEQEVRKRL